MDRGMKEKATSWGAVTVPIVTKDDKDYALVIRSDGPTLMLSVTEDGNIMPVSEWAYKLESIRHDVTGQFAYFSSTSELWGLLVDLIMFENELTLFEGEEDGEEASDSDNNLGD
jgi:hypothetical protein